MRIFKRIEERGYCDLLLAKYPNFRKYFSEFIKLPFQAQNGSQYLIEAIELIKKLDNGDIKSLPKDVLTHFVSLELRPGLKGKNGSINRNTWEMGLALAIREKLRSGDLYLPQSKQHVSFWDLMVSSLRWQEIKYESISELDLPQQEHVTTHLTMQFQSAAEKASKQWYLGNFAYSQWQT